MHRTNNLSKAEVPPLSKVALQTFGQTLPIGAGMRSTPRGLHLLASTLGLTVREEVLPDRRSISNVRLRSAS